MAQRAAAALAQQVEAAKRLTPVVKSAWRQFLETNAQYVDKEAPPSMLAKRLLFTSLATCVAPVCVLADLAFGRTRHRHEPSI
jgi:hypothetical protein